MSTLVEKINPAQLDGTQPYHSLRKCRTDAELKEALIELFGNRELRGIELDNAIREVARMICDLGTSEVSSLRTQGGVFAVFAVIGGLASIAGAVAHEGNPQAWLTNPPLFEEAVQKLRDNNDFVRPLCAGASLFCNLGSQGYGAWAKAEQDGYATAKSLAERVTLVSVRADQEHYNRTAERIAGAVRDLLRTNSVRG
jgi:hypothetical protein